MTHTVIVPREPTLGMLDAAERVGNALVGSDASSGEMIAAVWSALLAAAPKAEPDWNYEGAMSDLESAITVLIRRINGEADLASAAEWVRLNYPSRASEIVAHPEAPKADGMDAYTPDDMLNLISDEQARHLASSTDVSLVRARLKDILNAQLGDKSRRLNPEAPKADNNALSSKSVDDRISHDTDLKPEAPKVEQEPFGYAYAVPNDTHVLLPNKSLGGRAGKPLYTHPAPASDELLGALEAWAVEMTAKHGNPNGTDYEQGQNDMGFRVVSYLRSLHAKHKGPQS